LLDLLDYKWKHAARNSTLLSPASIDFALARYSFAFRIDVQKLQGASRIRAWGGTPLATMPVGFTCTVLGQERKTIS